MKKFIIILMVLAGLLVGYNCFQIDFKDPFSKDSLVAFSTVMAGLCAILVLAILLTSKRIEEEIKKKR